MINILFAGNDKMFDGILSAMLSIFMRTKTKEEFNFYILTLDLTNIKDSYKPINDEHISFLQSVATTYNKKNKITKIDIKDLYNQQFANCPNESAYCSPYTLLRLLIDLIPEMPEKILYLDADIMLNNDITSLYSIDVSKYEYASARDHYGKYLINPNYINAGVLLFNMNKIKSTKLFEKARNILRQKKLLFADQSAIYRSTTKKLMLPQKFNDQKFLHKHTVIRHFSKRLFWFPYPHTANIKQWNVSMVHKVFHYYQFDDILYEYIYLNKKFEQSQKEKLNEK